MNVKELIKLLQEQDPERIVIVSKDSEGNGFSPLADVSTGAYEEETTWSGHVGLEELTPELEALGYTEEDVVDGVPALILKPTN